MNLNEKKNPVIVHSMGIEPERLKQALEKDDAGPGNYQKKVVNYTVDANNKFKLEGLADNPGERGVFTLEDREKIERALSTAQLILKLGEYSTNKKKEVDSGGPFKKFKARFSQAFNLGRSPKEKAEAADALIATLKDPKAVSEMKKHHVKALTSGTLAQTVKQAPHVYQAVKKQAENLNEKSSNSMRLH